MTTLQTARLLLFGLLLSLAVSSFLFALHLFFLLDRFATDLPEVEATWGMIQQQLLIGSVLLIGGLKVREG